MPYVELLYWDRLVYRLHLHHLIKYKINVIKLWKQYFQSGILNKHNGEDIRAPIGWLNNIVGHLYIIATYSQDRNRRELFPIENLVSIKANMCNIKFTLVRNSHVTRHVIWQSRHRFPVSKYFGEKNDFLILQFIRFIAH